MSAGGASRRVPHRGGGGGLLCGGVSCPAGRAHHRRQREEEGGRGRQRGGGGHALRRGRLLRLGGPLHADWILSRARSAPGHRERRLRPRASGAVRVRCGRGGAGSARREARAREAWAGPEARLWAALLTLVAQLPPQCRCSGRQLGGSPRCCGLQAAPPLSRGGGGCPSPHDGACPFAGAPFPRRLAPSSLWRCRCGRRSTWSQ